MPNRLYNKQVTPKGYQKGGPVKKPKVRKIMAGGVGKAKDYPGIKEIIKLNKKGKKRFKDGGVISDEDRKKMQKQKVKLGLGAFDKQGNFQATRRKKMKMGGALKPVDPKTQKGLSKLPTEVRNKMGYMQKGGKVKKPAAGLFKFDKQTFLQFKDLMTGSSDAEINKNMKILKDSMEKQKKKEKKSNGK